MKKIYNRTNEKFLSGNPDDTFSKNKNLNLKLLNKTTKKSFKIIYNIISETKQVNNTDYTNTKYLLVG